MTPGEHRRERRAQELRYAIAGLRRDAEWARLKAFEFGGDGDEYARMCDARADALEAELSIEDAQGTHG